MLALHCREICMEEQAEGAKEETQQELHFKAFHGTEACASVVDLLLSAKGHYFAAFEQVDMEVNRAGNDARSECMWELKDLLHCSPNARFCIHDPGFTREALCMMKKDVPVSGRILYDKALQVIQNYKHALKHCDDYVDSNKNDPSGKKLEDILDYVRRRMCVEFKGCRNKPTGKAALKKPSVNAEDMPVKYVFNGYMAFALFGPRPLSSYTFTCFSKDGEGVEKKSRSVIKDVNKKTKDAERNAGTGGFVPEEYRRGVSLAAKASVAHLAQNECSSHLTTLREVLNSVIQDAKQTLDEYNSACEQLKEARELNLTAEIDNFVKWKASLMSDLISIREKKRQYESDLKSHLTKKPRQISALYDQVGTFKYEDSTTTTATASTGFTTPKDRPVTVVNLTGRTGDDTSCLTNADDNRVVTIDEDKNNDDA